ncbi:MAG: hypothetical protein U9N87_07020, partial [Planctomycetota bacterium]|nr:hypothetical protein [Planctomycetota bacterium]
PGSNRQDFSHREAEEKSLLNRQDFSHREAEEKSLLDEVLRCGRGERGRLGWDGCCEKGGWNGWVAGVCGI